MDEIDRAAIGITTAAFIAGPPLALGAFAVVRSLWPGLLGRSAIVCVLTLLFVLTASALGFSFTNEAGLACRVTLWGTAFSASGDTVHLYRTWEWLPLIERSVVRIPVVELGYAGDQPPPAADCSDAVRLYRN